MKTQWNVTALSFQRQSCRFPPLTFTCLGGASTFLKRNFRGRQEGGSSAETGKGKRKKQQLCLWKIKVKAGFWIPWGSTVFQAMKMTHFEHSNVVMYFKNTTNKFCPVVNSGKSRFSDLCVAVKTYYNCSSTSNPLRSSRQHNHFPVQAAHNAPLLLLLLMLRLFNNTNKWKLKTKINIYKHSD